jgi:hypothetical protein
MYQKNINNLLNVSADFFIISMLVSMFHADLQALTMYKTRTNLLKFIRMWFGTNSIKFDHQIFGVELKFDLKLVPKQHFEPRTRFKSLY